MTENTTPAWMNDSKRLEAAWKPGMLTLDELIAQGETVDKTDQYMFVEYLETNPDVTFTVEDYVTWRDTTLAEEEAQYERVESVKPETTTHTINGNLRKMVLARLGLTEGVVTVQEEKWDFGFCDTCSWPESGFSVQVDGNLVWPSKEYLNHFGGYIYADNEGRVEGKTLTSYGHFNAWLHGETFV